MVFLQSTSFYMLKPRLAQYKLDHMCNVSMSKTKDALFGYYKRIILSFRAVLARNIFP